jgi:hypothetical protein
MSKRSRTVEVLVCIWLVGAQVWYYSQFQELLRGVLSPLLRRLWH